MLESVMVYQFDPFAMMPPEILVWTCNFQPIWSQGQEKSRFDPLSTEVNVGRLVLTTGAVLASILAAKSTLPEPVLLVIRLQLPLLVLCQ